MNEKIKIDSPQSDKRMSPQGSGIVIKEKI